MQGHDFARAVGQHKQIAARQPPQIGGSILDGGFVLRGHQRPQIGQVGQQLSKVGEGKLALAVKILEGA